MNDNSSVLFELKQLYFAQKEHITVNIFEIFKCLGQNLSHSPYQFLKVDSSPNFVSLFKVMKDNSSVNFKLIFYFGLKDPINVPIMRLSSTLVKICHIPHFFFQTTSQFFFKYCIIFSVMKDNSSVPF